jgi:hypothetical protein
MTTIPMQIPNISNKSLIAASSWPFAINAYRQALFPVLRLGGLDVEELQCLLQVVRASAGESGTAWSWHLLNKARGTQSAFCHHSLRER